MWNSWSSMGLQVAMERSPYQARLSQLQYAAFSYNGLLGMIQEVSINIESTPGQLNETVSTICWLGASNEMILSQPLYIQETNFWLLSSAAIGRPITWRFTWTIIAFSFLRSFAFQCWKTLFHFTIRRCQNQCLVIGWSKLLARLCWAHSRHRALESFDQIADNVAHRPLNFDWGRTALTLSNSRLWQCINWTIQFHFCVARWLFVFPDMFRISPTDIDNEGQRSPLRDVKLVLCDDR